MASQGAITLRQKILGVLLRSARTRVGLTLADCAGALGISTQRMSEYEHGQQGISLPQVEILARLLTMPLSYFLNPPSRIEEPSDDLSPAEWIAARQTHIGLQIREARQAVFLSQNELATKLGIPATRLSGYEQGKQAIPLPALEAIADTLGLSMNHFVAPQHDKRALYSLSHLPEQLAAFVVEPGSIPYLRMASALSQLAPEDLRLIADIFSNVHRPLSHSVQDAGDVV